MHNVSQNLIDNAIFLPCVQFICFTLCYPKIVLCIFKVKYVSDGGLRLEFPNISPKEYWLGR